MNGDVLNARYIIEEARTKLEEMDSAEQISADGFTCFGEDKFGINDAGDGVPIAPKRTRFALMYKAGNADEIPPSSRCAASHTRARWADSRAGIILTPYALVYRRLIICNCYCHIYESFLSLKRTFFKRIYKTLIFMI